MALGHNIRKWRKKRGLSQDKLSVLTDGEVSQGAISALEKLDATSSKFTGILAKALNISVSELLTGTENTDTVDEVLDMLDKNPELIRLLKAAAPLLEYQIDVLVSTSVALAKQPASINNTWNNEDRRKEHTEVYSGLERRLLQQAKQWPAKPK